MFNMIQCFNNVHRMEMFIIFEIMRFFKLYGVSRSLSIESKESEDLSNAPRALIERLTNLNILLLLSVRIIMIMMLSVKFPS